MDENFHWTLIETFNWVIKVKILRWKVFISVRVTKKMFSNVTLKFIIF